MIDRMSCQIDDISAIAPVQVGDLAGTPMLGRDKSDGGARKAKTFPPLHFVDFFEAEAVDQVAHAGGDHNRLVGGDPAEAFAVQMVEVGVGNKNQVDIG